MPGTTAAFLVRRRLALAVALAAAIATAAVVVHHLTGTYWGDLEVYHGVARAVLRGQSPYDFVNDNGLLFTYPPFAALLFVPLAPLGAGALVWLWTAASVLALEAVVWVVLGHLRVHRPDRRAALALVALVAALVTFPVVQTLGGGQINIFIMLLVVADLLGVTRRYRGVGVGIAAGLKLTPLIFVPYLLLTGRVRAALVATATFAGTVVAGFLVFPRASAGYWSGTFLDGSRVTRTSQRYAHVFDQSIHGAFVRTVPDGAVWVWLPVAAVVGIGGLAVAAWAGRRGEELAGVLACAVTGLLVSPVSWHAHWVWCVPLVMLLAAYAHRHRSRPLAVVAAAVWSAFVASVYWLVLYYDGDPATEPDGSNPVFDNLYPLVGLLLLVVLAAYLRRTRPRAVDDRPAAVALPL